MFKKFITLGLFLGAQAAVKEDFFDQLPGFEGKIPFNAYSGYLKTLSDKRNLHYVFVESQNDPKNDPLVIWFNGGPGCSSLNGFFQENGPFLVDDELSPTHQVNEKSWNKVANMLYIESPAGVGYSTNEDKVQQYNDLLTSQDAIAALNDFYAKFEEFKPNDLFVSGESYGGAYVPYLSWQIVEQNKNTPSNQINLKGFLVGNGVTDWSVDTSPSLPDTAYGFQMIPTPLYNAFKDKCDLSSEDTSDECNQVFNQIQELISGVNPYDLYRYDPPSFNLKEEDRIKQVEIGGKKLTYKSGRTVSEYAPWFKSFAKQEKVHGDILSDYVNSAEVRSALNIPESVQAWQLCNFDINLNYQKNTTAEAPSLWIYKALKDSGIKMSFYSGDTDGVVPTYGTKQWIQKLNWESTTEYEAWTTKGQVSGFTQEYGNFQFTTIKGTGHMAPQWKKPEVFNYFSNTIAGKPLPGTKAYKDLKKTQFVQ